MSIVDGKSIKKVVSFDHFNLFGESKLKSEDKYC